MFGLPPEAAIAGLGAALAAVVYVIFANIEDKSAAKSNLSHLDSYGQPVYGGNAAPGTREADLEASALTRLGTPVFGWATGIAERLSPAGYVEGVSKKFQQAGRPDPDEVDRFLATRVLSLLALPVVFWLIFMWNPIALAGWRQYATFVVLAVALGMGPDMRLNREVEARQKEIVRMLPDVLDLLTISVEAGLGFEQALDRTIDSVPGPLTDEFARMLGETRAGSSRAEAMRNIDERCDVPELRSFILAVLQADTFGVSIGRVLRSQAEEMRIKRRQQAQERAMKAPVKMLIPMVFCIFPALFVVVLGPALINISEAF